MALIKCKECGKEISDKASTCPHCGIENDFIICPECKKEIRKRLTSCPNCGYVINYNNKFSVGIIIWLVICVIACFSIASINIFAKVVDGTIIANPVAMPYLAFLLGIAYIVLIFNKNKISFYILLGINAIILLYSLFSIGMFISIIYIVCVLINSIITFFVVRKRLSNSKLNLLGIISFSIALVVILLFSIVYPLLSEKMMFNKLIGTWHYEHVSKVNGSTSYNVITFTKNNRFRYTHDFTYDDIDGLNDFLDYSINGKFSINKNGEIYLYYDDGELIDYFQYRYDSKTDELYDVDEEDGSIDQYSRK